GAPNIARTGRRPACGRATGRTRRCPRPAADGCGTGNIQPGDRDSARQPGQSGALAGRLAVDHARKIDPVRFTPIPSTPTGLAISGNKTLGKSVKSGNLKMALMVEFRLLSRAGFRISIVAAFALAETGLMAATKPASGTLSGSIVFT